MLELIKSKILGFALIFSLFGVVSFADKNLLFASIFGFAIVICILYFKIKRIRASLPNSIGSMLSKQGVKSVVWSAVFFAIPTFFIYDDYMFAFNSTSQKVTVVKSTELICSYGRRSSRSESPCWDIEYVLQGKTLQKRMHFATKKGDTFNVNYLKDNLDERRYEDPIVDRYDYFKKSISAFEIISYLLFFYNFCIGMYLVRNAKKATGLVAPVIGANAKFPPKHPDDKIEPTFKVD